MYILTDMNSICELDEYGIKRYYKIATHDRPYELISKTVRAVDILEMIAKGMFGYAEPGIQNIDIARKYSNSDYLYNPFEEYDPRILGTNAPVIGTSLVPTSSGLFPIKDLYDRQQEVKVISDTITTLPLNLVYWKSKERELRASYQGFDTKTVPSIATFKHYPNQEVWEIKLSTGKTIKCNSEHRWFTQRGFVQTRDLQSTDSIFTPNGGILQAFNISIDKTCKSYTDGELLGYFTGDGFIVKESTSHLPIVGIIYTEDSIYYSDLFKKLYNNLTGKTLGYDRDRQGCFENRTENQKVLKYFSKFGYNSTKYIVPDELYTDFNMCAGFIKGLFDADGHVDKTRLEFTTVNEELAKKVHDLLSNIFGIHATIVVTKNVKGVKYGNGKISNAKTRYDLRISKFKHIKAFKQYIGFNIEYKQKNLEILCNRDLKKNIKSQSLVGILSVTKTSELEDMYCAVVPGFQSFVINGLISSNCSEQYLSRDSLCVLSSINVGRFSTDPVEYRKELAIIAPSVNRFLDNVNEYELRYKTYATPHQKIAIEQLRRTGAGSTNWEAWLFANRMAYGSPEGNKAAQDFNETYNYYLYKNSIELGKEKGSFGLFNKELYIQSPFIQHMMSLGLVFDYMRNVTCSSIAPTGTLSLMFRALVMSYGVEPGFGLFYWKRTRISGKYEYYFNVPNIVRQLFKEKGFEIPMNSDTIKDTWDGKIGKPIAKFIMDNLENAGIAYKDATKIPPLEKLEFMSCLMKDCDSSISVTYMLPEDSKWQDVYEFILEAYKKEVKSIAAYPDRKMYGIVSYIPFKELAFKLQKEGVTIHAQNFCPEEQKEMNIYDIEISNSSNAPKRPKVLNADIYEVTAKGTKFLVAIGLLGDKPYEIFCGELGNLNFKTTERRGKIEKISRGHYKLEIGEDIKINNFSEHFKEVESTIFRMVSTQLRHGIPMKFIVDQLQKSTKELQSLTAAAARVLKKYIKDGEKATGASCPSCKNTELIYAEGCVTCTNCGWSKCS
jgi:ribonucleotide reductase alpha subunit